MTRARSLYNQAGWPAGAVVIGGEQERRRHETHLRDRLIDGGNDEITSGIASFAQRRGIRVPDDLAVAGFDDSEIAQLIWPPLTTIRQPIAEMADRAITTLVAPATQPAARICCPVELVIRESTGGRSGTNG